MAREEVNYEILLRLEAKQNGLSNDFSNLRQTWHKDIDHLRELVTIVKDEHSKGTNDIGDMLKEIKTQVIKTNGRVRSLEVWRGFITGGLAIIGILVGFLISKL